MFYFFMTAIMFGFFKSICDTINHHFENSIFDFMTENEYNRSPTYKKMFYSFLKSDWKDSKLYFGIFRFDFWHLSDFTRTFMAGLAVYIGAKIDITDYFIIFAFVTIALFTFLIFYKVVWIKR